MLQVMAAINFCVGGGHCTAAIGSVASCLTILV